MIQSKTILALLILIILCVSPEVSGAVRPPAVSGTFYPGSRVELKYMVDSLLSKVPDLDIPGKPRAVISPHAGYIYSGQIAAYGYKALMGHSYSTVIVVGPSHRVGFRGCAVYDKGTWLTPLGSIRVDTAVASKLIEEGDLIFAGTKEHSTEHSIEVQLPFLQRVLGDFEIVPVEMGYVTEANILELANAMTEVVRGRDDVLIVASTDLSHYQPRSAAAKLDHFTIAFIDDLRGNDLMRALLRDEAQACGGGPTAATLIACKKLGFDRSEILKYDDSGTASGDTSRVVGYVSAVIYKEESLGELKSDSGDKDYLSREEQRTLIKIARASIEAVLSGDDIPAFDIPEGKLSEPGAAFVTLEKQHNLRGCIGYTEPIKPLHECVCDCAISAAFRDPRFPPLASEEYPDITVEISVLTPLEPVEDVSEIVVGRDGLMVSLHGRRGLLLPQVATEYGWNREEFLSATCRKAGLPENAWKEGAKIEKFSAFIFSEE